MQGGRTYITAQHISEAMLRTNDSSSRSGSTVVQFVLAVLV